MPVIKKQILLLFIPIVFLAGCFASKTEIDRRRTNFLKKNTTLVKEMAEYAVMFCLENNFRTFETDKIKNRKTRKKMKRLGNSVTLTYQNGYGPMTDSTVVFESITVLHGIKEFIYDFAVKARNEGTDTVNHQQGVLIQVSERVYYRRSPFPWM